jgi:hypothetical protein
LRFFPCGFGFLGFGGKHRKPSQRLPEEKPDWKEFLKKSEFWIGGKRFLSME